MKLTAGIYKVKLRTFIEEFAVLHVYSKEKRMYYRINNGPETNLDWLMERDPCQVIKQIEQLIVRKARIEIKITDYDGDYYTFSASDVQVVKQLFSIFPDVGKALGVRRKS